MEYFRLTTPQQNIWNLQKYYEDTAIANLCGAIIFKEKRNSMWLRQSVLLFVQNQKGLRLRFCEQDGPKQYAVDVTELEIPVMTFSSMEELDLYGEAFTQDPIGLVDRPMYRFAVFHVGNRSGILVLLSHLVSDAWTFGLMASQLDQAYRKLAGEDSISLICGDYTDYILAEDAYLASGRFEKDKTYWEERYESRPEESPVKLSTVPHKSIKAKRITRQLPFALEQKIAAHCRQYPVTPAVLFETALTIYLARINQDNQTITIGVPVLNRSNAREKMIAGMFVSMMPLTVSVPEIITVEELERQITRGHMDLFRHQKYPYAGILKSLREKQNFSGNLYEVMISYQNAKTDTGADTKWYSNGACEVPLTIHIDNRDGKNSHTINIDYQTGMFRDEAEVEGIIGRLEYLIEQITADPARPAGELRIVPDAERETVLYKWNDTYVEATDSFCIHELFSKQAEKTPDHIALVFRDKKITYRQLDQMSDVLAHRIREKGIRRNDVVPIITERSWHVIVAMLGVLKAGGAYMFVDPGYPAERIQSMLEIAECRFALCYGYSRPLSVECLDLERTDFEKNVSPLENINRPGDSAYIIFTSGSTGTPKGTVVSHGNVCNYAHNNGYNRVLHHILDRQYGGIVSVTNIIFDIFVTESIFPLLYGLSIYFADDQETVSQRKLSKLLTENPVDVIQTTPTRMRSYMLDKTQMGYLRRLKLIILGGEALPLDLYQELKSCTDARICNIYGPAETTVWSANTEVLNGDITIGSPVANTQIYILDKTGAPVPIGVAGELCIAGAGVGKGYLNRPELTAERFVPNPFATEENRHGKIMYHTGDLARWRTDGKLEYLGRMDTQVKIRGLRIELGEVESVMGTMEGLGLVAVADRRDENGRQYLVGYYTADETVDEKELRQHLSARLPKYMVPNYFVHLKEMPVTASGKVDRRNLPSPDYTVRITDYTAPETEQERVLCQLLEGILHVEPVGIADDFFECGGDSLAAIEYVAKAHSKGIGFALQNVFDYPTVQSLCEFLARKTVESDKAERDDFEKYHSLFANNIVDETVTPGKKSLGNVLLTGATGFLGAHILDCLMQEESGKICCLVRGKDGETYRSRLEQILKYYFGNKYEAEYGNRIIAVEGTIERPDLGDSIPADIQTVIHAAASVKHYGAYGYFKHVNVEGTKHVLDYTRSVGAKLIHISTLSVSGNSLADNFAVYRSEEEKHFDERFFYIGQSLDNVYIRSKFEAEKLVFDAMLQGMDAKVIRIGNLTNRISDYRFQPNYRQNAFLTRVKAVLEFGWFPDYLMPLYTEFSPVDLTASGIVKIAQYAESQNLFHLNSNRPVYFERFLEILQELDIFLKVTDEETFHRKLLETMKQKGTEYIFEALQNDMDSQGKLVYDSNIRIQNDFTTWFLRQTGFTWKETDQEYVKGYINYFRKIGYLKV